MGSSLGDVFEVGPGSMPSVGVDDDGRFVVAWHVLDGRQNRPAVRRYRLTCAPGYEQRCP